MRDGQIQESPRIEPLGSRGQGKKVLSHTESPNLQR
jgi:hypothetical protein